MSEQATSVWHLRLTLENTEADGYTSERRDYFIVYFILLKHGSKIKITLENDLLLI